MRVTETVDNFTYIGTELTKNKNKKKQKKGRGTRNTKEHYASIQDILFQITHYKITTITTKK